MRHFSHLLSTTPRAEQTWQRRYQKSPILSLHLSVQAEVIVPGTECYHIFPEQWDQLEVSSSTVFVSISTLLDRDLAPPGHHVLRAFAPHWIEAW